MNLKIRSVLLDVLKMIGIIVLLSFVLTVVLSAIYSIPINEKKYQKSVEILKEEGANQDLAILYDILRRSYTNESRFTGHEFVPGTVSTRLDYPRYWHGHIVVLRLLLAFFDLTEIRFLSFIIQMLLVVFLLVRKGNDKIDNRIASLFLVALAPIGWQIVLRNHVVWHNSLTYRQLGIAAVVVFVGAVLITFAMREHQLISNSNIPGHYVYIEDNAEAVMSAISIVGEIKSMKCRTEQV